MSREIKFRVWSGKDNTYIKMGSIMVNTGIDTEFSDKDGAKYIVEQYTGIKDKNGKEIYEGDIVKFGCGDQTPAEVVYQDGSYFIKALDDGTLFYDPDANKPCPFGWFETYGLEVIGNIHESNMEEL